MDVLRRRGDFYLVRMTEEEHLKAQIERQETLTKYGVINPCPFFACYQDAGHGGAHGIPEKVTVN